MRYASPLTGLAFAILASTAMAEPVHVFQQAGVSAGATRPITFNFMPVRPTSAALFVAPKLAGPSLQSANLGRSFSNSVTPVSAPARQAGVTTIAAVKPPAPDVGASATPSVARSEPAPAPTSAAAQPQTTGASTIAKLNCAPAGAAEFFRLRTYGAASCGKIPRAPDKVAQRV